MCSEILKRLIQSGAGEREIQTHIKSDLNILGETCTPSKIKGEYIAFSEFPILDENPGFVVFTGRSTMEIVIVEIKGADFTFLSSTVAVNANILAAARRMRDRFRHIDANYESFRYRFYDIRRQVEAGETLYHSTPGPAQRLEVDPAQQVWLKGMVIGGRTKEDLKEARVRNLLERETPRITYDTWDSWLKNNGQYGNVLRSHYPSKAPIP